MRHRHDAAVVGCEKCRGQCGVLDVAAAELEPLGQKAEIDVARQRRLPRPDALPDPPAIGRVGKRERHHECEAADERIVEVLPQVAREDRDAVVALDALQQVADLEIRVAIMGIAHFGPLAEQRVRLVEQ